MPTVNDITVLNIDDVPYAVESLSEEVQNLVGIYNSWNQKESDVRDELAIHQAAKQTLSGQIVAKVREETANKADTADGEVNDSGAAEVSSNVNVTTTPDGDEVEVAPSKE